MLKEKAGALAGQIWEALNGTEGLTQKQIKKANRQNCSIQAKKLLLYCCLRM